MLGNKKSRNKKRKARRNVRSKGRNGSRKRNGRQPDPGWLWMLCGVCIGLAIAFVVSRGEQAIRETADTVNDAAPPQHAPDEVKESKATKNDLPENKMPESKEPTADKSVLADNAAGKDDADTAAVDAAAEAERFTFYSELPNFEVIIPEDAAETSGAAPQPETRPGAYMLQAGSFTRHDDAGRRRAELALQGIESAIRRMDIDGATYYRIYIGPIRDLDELNRIRRQLYDANIDTMRIRIEE